LALRCPYCGKPIQVSLARVKENKSMEGIKAKLKPWLEGLKISEDENAITIVPKNYLGRKVWQSINDALKPFRPEWVSAGKQSKWVIRK